MVILSSHHWTESLTSVGLLNSLLQLCDFNSVLVLHTSEFTQVSVLQDGMCLTEEVIDEKSKLVTTHLTRLLSVAINKRIDAAWYRVVSEVGLVLVVEGAVDAHDAALAWSSHTSLWCLSWILLAHELGWIFTKTHEAAAVHLAGDSVSTHRFSSCNIFNRHVTITLSVG